MTPAIRVIGFSFATIGLFWALVTWGIPPIDPAPPPDDLAIDVDSLTPVQLAALGERVYGGKGACALCHTADGNRAPALGDPMALAQSRLDDPRYSGAATNATEFLHESLIAPSAFVARGYGVAGSGDRKSPMPDVRAGALRLSDVEITAVLAFLQHTSGTPITVTLPVGETTEDDEEDARPPLTDGPAVLAYFECLMCHQLGDEGEEIGPPLTAIGTRYDADYLRRAITDPNADLPEGFEPDMMPPDYAEQMSAVELDHLVNYLAGLE